MNEILLILLAYLIGSIPTSVWVSRYFFDIDIRDYGSGNAGATNTYRVLGPKWGTFVMIVDMIKGVLAILARMMGASSVVAVDNDEWSIRNATENIRANDCTNIRLLLRDEPLSTDSFQVILANINKHVILDHFKTLVERLSQNGTILVSGVLEADREEIITGGEKYQLRFIEESRVGEWICLRFSG